MSDMESFENIQDLVRDMNKEIKSGTGEVYYTDGNLAMLKTSVTIISLVTWMVKKYPSATSMLESL